MAKDENRVPRKPRLCGKCKYLWHKCWCKLLAKCVNPRYPVNDCPKPSMRAVKNLRRQRMREKWHT